MPTDNNAVAAALLAQITEMQRQLAALMNPPASAYFTDANSVEWIAEGIKRWNYGIDQATLLPPVPLPAPGHNGWWDSGDPHRYQQRDPAFLKAELKRIRDEWPASRPPAPPPKVYPPGSRG